jgi:hypothetical protein
MIAVGMVQVSIDQIIDVAAMGNRLMTAARAMPMRRIMAAAAMIGRAALGIFFCHLDHVFIGATRMRMLEMAVVEVIDVAMMSNRDVTAAGPVNVRMIGGGHDPGPFLAIAPLQNGR